VWLPIRPSNPGCRPAPDLFKVSKIDDNDKMKHTHNIHCSAMVLALSLRLI
jgi:hypothetical protein